ncbi:hypothetical protein FS837_007473, partial [Tulasnella sp. UAMH 9824]
TLYTSPNVVSEEDQEDTYDQKIREFNLRLEVQRQQEEIKRKQEQEAIDSWAGWDQESDSEHWDDCAPTWEIEESSKWTYQAPQEPIDYFNCRQRLNIPSSSVAPPAPTPATFYSPFKSGSLPSTPHYPDYPPFSPPSKAARNPLNNFILSYLSSTIDDATFNERVKIYNEVYSRVILKKAKSFNGFD